MSQITCFEGRKNDSNPCLFEITDLMTFKLECLAVLHNRGSLDRGRHTGMEFWNFLFSFVCMLLIVCDNRFFNCTVFFIRDCTGHFSNVGLLC